MNKYGRSSGGVRQELLGRRRTLHLVGVMEDKYTPGMITTESKLGDITQAYM
jgi:hypothetical protein